MLPWNFEKYYTIIQKYFREKNVKKREYGDMKISYVYRWKTQE